MKDLVIRKFEHTDVDDFIRLSKISFAEESIAAGITPEDFERETRRIFRWKMLPYKMLTALMGVKWEAFVAERDGKVVGGGMYIGRHNRMTITNLMVDPVYRRQGIGQALLIKRLERLSERGFPYALAQVLDTNVASLRNLMKQHFEVFNQYTVYEHALPLPAKNIATSQQIICRDIDRSDKGLFQAIEKGTTPQVVLHLKGSLETRYFPSGSQKLYDRFTGYSKWIRAFVYHGETVGFLCVYSQSRQRKGILLQPVITDECLQYLPAIFHEVGIWLEEAEKEAMTVEIPDRRTQIKEYLLENGWKKQYTWLELVRWLDKREGQKFKNLSK